MKLNFSLVMVLAFCSAADMQAVSCATNQPAKPSVVPAQKGLNERSLDNQEDPFLEKLNALIGKYESKFSNEKQTIKDSIEQFFITLQSIADSDNHIKNLKGRVRGMHKWIQEQFSVSDISNKHRNDWQTFLDQLGALGK